MNDSVVSTPQQRPSNLGTAASRTSLSFLTAIAKPSSAVWKIFKTLACSYRPTRREKKGWPPLLFVALVRVGRSFLENRRSLHGGRPRSGRSSLDQPLPSADRPRAPATRLPRQCQRGVSASATASLGTSQGSQSAAAGRTSPSRSPVSDHRPLACGIRSMPRSHREQDTKAKEFLGLLFREGRLYTQKAKKALDHDFPSAALGVLYPYGLYDTKRNLGHLNLGLSHDTSRFACAVWVT